MTDTMDTSSVEEKVRAAVTKAITELSDAGAVPRLYINTKALGTIFPEHILQASTVEITLRPEYPLNLEHTSQGLLADLAFDGALMRCFMPWRSIFAVSDAKTGIGICIRANLPPLAQLVEPEVSPPPSFRHVKGGEA